MQRRYREVGWFGFLLALRAGERGWSRLLRKSGGRAAALYSGLGDAATGDASNRSWRRVLRTGWCGIAGSAIKVAACLQREKKHGAPGAGAPCCPGGSGFRGSLGRPLVRIFRRRLGSFGNAGCRNLGAGRDFGRLRCGSTGRERLGRAGLGLSRDLRRCTFL